MDGAIVASAHYALFIMHCDINAITLRLCTRHVRLLVVHVRCAIFMCYHTIVEHGWNTNTLGSKIKSPVRSCVACVYGGCIVDLRLCGLCLCI